jgi:hypothetical protein
MSEIEPVADRQAHADYHQLTDEEKLAILHEPAQYGSGNSYVSHETGEEIFDLPAPPAGHLWTNGDIARLRAGLAPAYPHPHLPVPATPAAVDVAAGVHTNVDTSGVNHFLRVVEGEGEKCGGCAQAWPCDAAVRMGENTRETHGQLPQGAALDAAARILNLDPKELLTRLTG